MAAVLAASMGGIMRRIIPMVLGFVLVMGSSVPAGAARPDVQPPKNVEYGGVFDAGFPCEFAMGFYATGKEGHVIFNDRGILTAPGFTVTLTNLDNYKTRTYRVPGVFHETYFADGTVRVTAVGPNLLFGIFDGEPGMFLTIGKIVADTDHDFFEWTWVEEETKGSIVDVCAQLDD